jgi:lipid A 3-O-deacylase
MLAVMVSLRPASSADLPSEQPAPNYPASTPPPAISPPVAYLPPDVFDPRSFELRFGAFAHGVGGVEQGTVDLNPEFVFPRLPFGEAYWWSVLLPRPHVGGLINLEGRTSAVYAGGLWTFPLPHRFFAELFLDGEKHDGYLNDPPPDRAGLGCPYLFHAGGSLGYSLSRQWSLMFTFDHQSNGHHVFGTECDGMGGNTSNPGINDYGLRVGYSF